MATNTRGISNLVTRASSPPSRIKQFFRPIFTNMPGAISSSFKIWGWGAESVGPVNLTQSWGGVQITPEVALSISSVWACAWRYATTVSTMPLFFNRVGPGNSATRALDHRLDIILHDRPNAQMSASAFWMSMVMGMMLWGSGFAKKLRVGGEVVGLKPWRPEWVTIYRTASDEIRYRYAPSADQVDDLPAADVFHVFDRSADGYTGLSRLEYARHSFGLAIAGDRASGLAHKNGLRASGFITVAQWLTEKQREIYRTHLADFMGTGTGESTDKQGGVMLLENATKFEPLTMKPLDVELLASRKFSVEDVCRWFDIPPVLVGHSAEGQTMWGSGVEQVILGWVKLGLGHVLRRIEQEIHRQLLTPAEQTQYFAEFNMEALLRGDSQARATFMSTMAQNGLRTRDELRAVDNLPPLPGGDELTVQSNLVRLNDLGKIPGASVQVREAMRAWLGIEDQPAEVERET